MNKSNLQMFNLLQGKKLLITILWLLYSAVGLAESNVSIEITAAKDWCRLDDPAYYMEERKKLIDKGERDMSTITCPEILQAETLPDELLLPMPCGHRMVFRKISVPAETLLDQYNAAFGSISKAGNETPLTAFSSGPWYGVVAGSFSLNADGNPARSDLNDLAARAYYIGKYEVTSPQYDLFTTGLLDDPDKGYLPTATECNEIISQTEKLKATQIKPAGKISWYSAIAFSRKWNEWLLAIDQKRISANLKPYFPWEQGSPAYVRLPTEAEWEFAARGGIAGSASEDQGRSLYKVFDPKVKRPRESSLNELAVISQPGSRSLIGGVGQRLPNLLGLYDTIGNVEEIVLDSFRMTRPDVLHGQSGGYVVRGGSSISNSQFLGVGLRREMPLFRLDGEVSSKVTGMRLVVTAPVFVAGVAEEGNRYQTGLQNPNFIKSLELAREQLSDTSALPGGEFREELKAELERLRQEQTGAETNERFKEQLAKLELSLEQSETALQEAARNAFREKIKAAVITSTTIRSLGRLSYNILLRREEIAEQIESLKPKPADRQRLKKRLDNYTNGWRDMEEQIDFQFSFFLSMIIDIAKAKSEQFDQALTALKNEFASRQITIYDKIWPTLENQIIAVRKNDGRISEAQKDKWRYELDDTLDRREERFNFKSQ